MSTDPVGVREGTAADLPAVFAIADTWIGGKSKLYYQDNEQRALIRTAVDKGNKRLLLAELEGQVVGFAVYVMEGEVAFITLVITARDHGRRGVASELIRAVVARHTQVGACNDVGPEMKQMYVKLGFRCIDKFQPGPYRNWVFER
ncbi:MAG: GNAT family N-acetyltransferase [Elusimicrobia bacterium]|nr:GNAT family N-acetyltransferase [Elusimicrobiota bacterium]